MASAIIVLVSIILQDSVELQNVSVVIQSTLTLVCRTTIHSVSYDHFNYKQ